MAYRDPTPISPKQIDYDKSKVDPRVSNYTKQVRDKQHGIDTREAMARAEEISSVVSTEAKELSEKTKVRQDVLEKQFDEQIENMTLEDPSSAEMVAAHVNANTGESWTTIGRRLDDENKKVNEQLEINAERIEEINTNVLAYGVKGDGETDDIPILQSLVDSLPSGSKLNFPPKRVFKITRPLIITRGDISINFNNSPFRYAGTEDLGSDNGIGRMYGAIAIRGKLIEETKTNVVDIVSNEGVIDQEFYSNGDNFKGLKHPFTQVTKIVTDNELIGTMIKKGDFVSVYVRNHNGTWDKNYGDNPSMLNVIAHVIYVDGANVYVDVCSDLRFNPDKVNGTITLLQPVNNVTIENLVFEDINDTPIPNPISNNERDSWVGGISVQYATNFTLTNYKASRHRFPALLMRNVYNPIIDNFVASYPRTVTAGCGYGMQIMSSVHGTIKNARGYGLRHLIDFTSSGHMRVVDSRMPNDWHGAFDCHGMGEFDITYVNCVGNFLAGNGINEFPEMTGNITLENCKGSLQMSWAQRIHVNNSLLYFDAIRDTKSPHIEILNSKLVFKRTKYNFAAVPRGVYMQTAFIIDNNTTIEITNENNPWQEWTNKLFEIDAYKKVRISNIPYVRNLRNDVMLITIAKCTDTTINGNLLTNLGFNLTNTTSIDSNAILADNSMAAGVLRIKDNKIDESINASDPKNFFTVSNVDDISSYLIMLDGNMFFSLGKMRWIRTEINTFNVNIIAVNNLLRGRVGAFYKAGLMEPNFITKDGNIDLSDTDEPSRLKNYDVKSLGISISSGWNGYEYKFTPEKVQPDNSYMVDISPQWDCGNWWIESKTTTGFNIKFSKSPTATTKLDIRVTRE
ncbi:hypothetical protein NST77_23245 [Niallia sp. FSL W8-0177]|uniref:hypothetical protein n=1 Tax=Niallia sp. FSL W8-0177 TaxID=2954522 RepID=UPI0030FAA5CC